MAYTTNEHITTDEQLVVFKADSHIACRSLPFTQCHHVWFTLAMPCHAHAIILKVTAQHGCRDGHAVALRITTWSEHGMGMAWQVWIRHGGTM